MVELRIGTLSLTGDSPSEGAGDWQVVPSGLVQVTQAIGAAGINIQDRGNYSYTITFSVQREHLTGGKADPDAAALFVETHIMAVRKMGRSVFTKKTGAGSVYYYPALATVTKGTVEGCRTFHTYKVVAGSLTTAAPGGASGGFLQAGNPTFSGGLTPY